MNLTTRGHSLGHYEFTIDGMETVTVKSVEGGLPKGNTIEEQIGPQNEYIKHISTIELDPMTIEVAMNESSGILDWCRESFDRKPSRKNGHIRHASFDHKETFVHHFYNALISEITFPTLDGAGKELAYLKLKLQPEKIKLETGSGAPIGAPQAFRIERQKQWNTSAFRLLIDGLELDKVGKIDSFTVKQGLKAVNCGQDRLPEWEPSRITFPDISVHMTMHYAADVIAWYEKTIVKGFRCDRVQRTGAIEFLDTNKRDVIFSIALDQVGIKSLTIDKSEKQDAMKKIKFDIFCSKMAIDGKPLVG